jgi:hypothetical protein
MQGINRTLFFIVNGNIRGMCAVNHPALAIHNHDTNEKETCGIREKGDISCDDNFYFKRLQQGCHKIKPYTKMQTSQRHK